jgi:hypothetical protein
LIIKALGKGEPLCFLGRHESRGMPVLIQILKR